MVLQAFHRLPLQLTVPAAFLFSPARTRRRYYVEVLEVSTPVPRRYTLGFRALSFLFTRSPGPTPPRETCSLAVFLYDEGSE